MLYKIKNIRDEEEYEIEEVPDSEDLTEIEEIHDDAILTEEEIASLKQLAAVAGELMSLLHSEKEEPAHDKDEDEDEEIEEVHDEEEIEEEKVIDTEEKVCGDSRKSFGSIERKSPNTTALDSELEVANAWAKRYGGK